METCDYITKYGACASSCERFDVSCPWARPRGWKAKDYLAEGALGLGIIMLCVLAVLA